MASQNLPCSPRVPYVSKAINVVLLPQVVRSLCDPLGRYCERRNSKPSSSSIPVRYSAPRHVYRSSAHAGEVRAGDVRKLFGR